MSSPLREIMKERPILFRGEMVRAILDGRKTMTRRVVKTNNHSANLDTYFMDGEPSVLGMQFTDGTKVKCPYGKVGDRLWVRETWGLRPYAVEAIGRKITNPLSQFLWEGSDFSRPIATKEFIDNHILTWGVEWEWKAAYAGDFSSVHWRPSTRMPRWASRLTLEITGVRVERLQDISDADALSEGVERLINEDGFIDYHPQWGKVIKAMDAASSFRSLWDSINAAHGLGWDTNPWVWVITFNMVVP